MGEVNMKETERRLTILNRNELHELYGLPRFTDEERVRYFFLDQSEIEELENFRTSLSKIYFILQLGYFKAKKRFFVFQFQEVKDDIYYISEKYRFKEEEITKTILPKSSRKDQYKIILKLLDYQICTQERKKELQEKAFYLVTIHAKPIYIFKELFNYLEKEKIIVPAYSTMQTIVSKAITREKERLGTVIMKQLS